MVSWSFDRVFRVLASGEFIGEEARQVGHQGGYTLPGAARASPRCQGVWPLVGLLHLVFWFRVAHGKILTLAFVPSNSENIDFLPFWNQKQKKNRKLALWKLVNRLVLENI